MRDMLTSSQEKRRIFEQMLELGKTMLHFDPRRFGVDVPRHLASRMSLQLDYSLRFNLDVFEITDRAVVASLSFGGKDHLCKVPWSAVFGMYSHVSNKIALWPEDAPEELQAKTEADAIAEAELPTPDARVDESAPPRGFRPVVVEKPNIEDEPEDRDGNVDFKDEPVEEDPEPVQFGGAVRRVGHLRIVK